MADGHGTWSFHPPSTIAMSHEPLAMRSVSRIVAQENDVAWTAFFQTATHTLYFHGESAVAQALLESSILSRRPDGQHASRFECLSSIREPAIVVERGVVRCSERGWAVIDIEQHRVEAARARAQRERDVAFLDHHAPILQ